MKLKHIAIIMDGNGRWAKRRGLPRSEGHRAGTETAGRIARAVRRMDVPYLTLYALSTENLYRPQKELDALMALMRHYLDHEVPSLIENRVRMKIIGNRDYLPQDLKDRIRQVENQSRKNYKMTLCLAICYGGRDEIVRAVKSLAKKGHDLEKITEKKLTDALDTKGIPDPDLLIRTGGDHRISNFLIWECAYSELYFTKTLWPDFSTRHLRAAMDSYYKRERRFGKIDDAVGHGEPSPRKRGKLK